MIWFVIERLCNELHDYFCRAMLASSTAFAHAVSVRPSVMFIHSVKTNKDIFEIFLPSGSHTILVSLYQTS